MIHKGHAQVLFSGNPYTGIRWGSYTPGAPTNPITSCLVGKPTFFGAQHLRTNLAVGWALESLCGWAPNVLLVVKVVIERLLTCTDQSVQYEPTVFLLKFGPTSSNIDKRQLRSLTRSSLCPALPHLSLTALLGWRLEVQWRQCLAEPILHCGLQAQLVTLVENRTDFCNATTTDNHNQWLIVMGSG